MVRKPIKPAVPGKPAVPELRVVPPEIEGVAPEGPVMENDGDTIDLLDAKKAALAACCAEGATLREASTTTGIPYRTCRRYRQLPEVQARIRELAREAISAGTLSLGQGAADAARSLRAIAKGSEAAEGPRVSACRSILEIGLRVLEVEELTERVENLEAQSRQPGQPAYGRGNGRP